MNARSVRGLPSGVIALRSITRAFGEDERPAAFLRLVPCFGEDPGYSLDLMQRDPDSVNGITEFLIANAALALGERGSGSGRTASTTSSAPKIRWAATR